MDQTHDSSEINVDDLLASIGEGPTAEGPTDPETPAAASAPETPEPAPPSTYKIKVNGQEIDATVDQLQQWAQQGYHYSQQKNNLEQQRTQFQKELEEAKRFRELYAPVDEYAQKNPQWWDSITQSFQSRDQIRAPGDGQDNPVFEHLNSLKSELSEMKKNWETFQAEKAEKARIEQDQALNSQIEEVRKQYKDVSLEEVDDTGKSLENRVLDFAIENNIADFRNAFRLFNHERLMKLAEERGMQQLVKDRQKQTKLGLLGQSPTPTRGIQKATNIREKSYDSLLDEALEELNNGSISA